MRGGVGVRSAVMQLGHTSATWVGAADGLREADRTHCWARWEKGSKRFERKGPWVRTAGDIAAGTGEGIAGEIAVDKVASLEVSCMPGDTVGARASRWVER